MYPQLSEGASAGFSVARLWLLAGTVTVLLLGTMRMSVSMESPVVTPSSGSEPIMDLLASHIDVTANNTVSLSVRNATIDDVLDEIGRQAHADLLRIGSFPQRLSLRFDRLPIQKALITVLKDHSYLLYTRVRGHHGCESTADAIRIYSLESTTSSMSDSSEPDGVCAPSPSAESQGAAGGDVKGAPPENLPTLAVSLTLKVPEVREAMVEALTEMGNKPAILALGEMIYDSDEDVRDEAISALSEIDADEAAKALSAALEDGKTALRLQVVDALADMHSDAALQALETAASDKDEQVRQAAREYLDELQVSKP